MHARKQLLNFRLRFCTLVFMVGLILSGATAIPLASEVDHGARVLGDDMSWHGRLPSAITNWLRTVQEGIHLAARQAPMLFYGTDWLAFGHFVIAAAFIGALRDPVRNRWLYEFGMIACAAVPVWAFIMGPIRDIPLWWRCIDASFGVAGFLPVYLCHRWARELENIRTSSGVCSLPRIQSPIVNKA